MTVAPSRSNTRTHDVGILRSLQRCWQRARHTNQTQIASLALPLPVVDPLVVLLTLAPETQRQCYLESPARGQAIAGWEELISECFWGPDRFAAARQYLATWQDRILAVPERPEGPYFFCSFSFFDTPTETVGHFAPATVSLTRWQVVRCHQRCLLIANVLIRPRMALAPLATAIGNQLSRLQRLAATPLTAASQPASQRAGADASRLSAPEATLFQQQVQQTLAAIQAQQVQKRVVAHALDITRRQPFHRAVALPRLRSRHPDCYVFSFSGRHRTHFIGASPERLLSIRQGRLVTDALAGSAPRGRTASEDQALGQQLLQTAKEQWEHQLVLEFIVQQLRAQGLSPRYSTPPGLLRLSHIQHLHTPIRADVPRHLSPLALVEALHPTPAVAGVPTGMACELIRQGERCDRGLYAAPLGWVDPQGNGEFIVGIRSALIHDHQARLYAGAGIVAGSDPARELAEIQLKLQALAEALG